MKENNMPTIQAQESMDGRYVIFNHTPDAQANTTIEKNRYKPLTGIF